MADEPIVAVVGTGRMGGAMTATLRRAGHTVVVHNRTRAKAQEVADATGAAVAGTAREAVADADVVVCSLADDAAVAAVYRGPDGVAAGLRRGAVVAETSTVAPRTVLDLWPLVEPTGAALLDAPVSGSVSLVEEGALTVMAGGDPGAVDRARPVLDALAAKVFHVGDLGAGMTMKLAVNNVVHALNQALSEALVLAEQAGVSRSAAYDVFAASAVAAPFVHYKRQSFEHPEQAPVAFSLELVAKDLDLILALAERVGARMDQAVVNRAVARSAVDAGLGDADLSAIAGYLRGTG